MILWNKAPNARVGRMEAVVTHHPVVVHGKTVARGALAIDIDFVSLYGKLMTFISADDALVPSNVLRINSNALAFARHLKTLKIGHGVVDIEVFGELI